MKVMRKSHILQQADVSQVAVLPAPPSCVNIMCIIIVYCMDAKIGAWVWEGDRNLHKSHLMTYCFLLRLPSSWKRGTSWHGPIVLGSLPSTMPFKSVYMHIHICNSPMHSQCLHSSSTHTVFQSLVPCLPSYLPSTGQQSSVFSDGLPSWRWSAVDYGEKWRRHDWSGCQVSTELHA